MRSKASGTEKLEDPASWLAVLGEHDRKMKENTEQVVTIKRIVQHPGYTCELQFSKADSFQAGCVPVLLAWHKQCMVCAM